MNVEELEKYLDLVGLGHYLCLDSVNPVLICNKFEVIPILIVGTHNKVIYRYKENEDYIFLTEFQMKAQIIKTRFSQNQKSHDIAEVAF